MTHVVGFSPHKDDHGAIALACRLARSDADDVHAVTVVPQGWPTAVAGDTDREFEAWAAEQGAEASREASALLAEHPDVAGVATWVAGRSVPQALLDRAEVLAADLVVVGSGDAGAPGRVSLTSKVDRLLHSSPLPVAIAPRDYAAAPEDRVTRVTVAFRGDDETWALLDRVAEIVRRVDAAIRLVTFAVRAPSTVPPRVSRAEDQVYRQWRRQSEEGLAEAAGHLGSLGFRPDQVEAEVVVGTSWTRAVDAVSWRDGDVLVVGSSATHRLAQVFLGSSATRIVRHSPVPVIVVPASR
ncbi:MAG: universal stress protein [Nocardioidaceae bacterium]